MTASDLILRDYPPEVNDELITAGVEALQNLDEWTSWICARLSALLGLVRTPTWSFPCNRAASACSPVFRAFRTLFLSVWWSAWQPAGSMAASLRDLRAVDGVGEARARIGA